MNKQEPSIAALLVSVHYQCMDATLRFLDSLDQQDGASQLQVVVVINGTREGQRPAMRLLSGRPRIHFVESETNIGYFPAAKLGLEWYRQQQGPFPRWIVVCNNDVVLPDPRFFRKLAQLDHQGVAVLAPSVVSGLTGVDQNPHLRRRPGWMRMAALRFWLSTYRLAWLQNHLSIWKQQWKALLLRLLVRKPKSGPGFAQRIYAPHGSFVIFSHIFFEQGGFIDDSLFLYGEEISVAEICRRIKLPVVYEPGLVVLHESHRSTGRPFNPSKYRAAKQAFSYLSKHYLPDVAKLWPWASCNGVITSSPQDSRAQIDPCQK